MEKINKKLIEHRKYNDKYRYIIKERNRIRYVLNKDDILKKNKLYRMAHAEEISAKRKEWCIKNKEYKSESDRRYYLKNKEKHSLKCKIYYQSNKNDIQSNNKEYRRKNLKYYHEYNKRYYNLHKTKIRKLQYEYRKLRCQEDISFRLSRILSKRVWDALNKHLKKGKTQSNKLYGIDVDAIAQKLIKELPKDFEFGKYHADHIIPIACFDLNDSEQLKACFRPENYQWLLAKDNLDKGDKILKEHEPLYLELKNRFKLKK